MYIRQNARFDRNVNFPVPAVPITIVFVYSSPNARFDGNVNFQVPAVPITTVYPVPATPILLRTYLKFLKISHDR